MCEKHDSIQNEIYPLLLEGVVVPTIWGGHRLYQNYGKGSADIAIGETWELSVRSDRKCKIKNGPRAGYTLEDFISQVGNEVVFDGYDGEHFPLLIKFIDATDKLSVQVHPDDEYAAVHENSIGKNELWYIVSAEPGAEIIYGFKAVYSQDQIRRAITNGQLDAMLNHIKVKTGDVFYVPSGLVHAIGKGILIAEIQQNSDLTYRLYDYDRKDANGNKRELHIDRAIDSIKQYSLDEIHKKQFECAGKSIDCTTLANNPYFRIQNVNISDEPIIIRTKNCFHSLLCIGGSGYIYCNGNSYNISAGDCWFIPAGGCTCELKGNLNILKITPQFKNQEA